MNLLDRFSSSLISALGWVYERFARFASMRPSQECGSGGQRSLSGLAGHFGWDAGRLLFDAGACSQCLHFDTCTTLRDDSRPIDKRLRQPDRMHMVNANDRATAHQCVRVDDLLQALALDPPKDLSAVRRRQRDKAIALIQDEALLEAVYSFNNLRLQRIDDGSRLQVGGESLPMPTHWPKRGEVTAISCGACTLGPRIEARVRRLFAEKRAAQAFALDSVGNELLLALGRRMQTDILTCVRRQGLILGQALQFSESAFDLSTRAAVLRLAGATEIGITLHRGSMLLPQKATSVVFAIGHNLTRAC
jgi:hypothetical protein